MAKGFTEREKQAIRLQLIEKGKNLFETLGVKKTSVKELTDSVGIAQGSFYTFFSSKEELCFEIIELEEIEIKRVLVDFISSQERITKEVFKGFLLRAFTIIDESPLIKGLMVNNEYENMLRKLPEDKISAHIEKDEDALDPVINYWQEMGYIVAVDPKIIAGAMRALFMISLHKKEIGVGIFDEVLELWCDCFAKGLVLEEVDVL